MFSALSRRFREGDISERELEILIEGFSRDWKDFAVIDFDETEAGELARKYGLRGLDAIHLSAVKVLRTAHDNISLSFSSFDKKLNEAAIKEGLKVLSL
jgi:predicted nucleic acid-binding protein